MRIYGVGQDGEGMIVAPENWGIMHLSPELPVILHRNSVVTVIPPS